MLHFSLVCAVESLYTIKNKHMNLENKIEKKLHPYHKKNLFSFLAAYKVFLVNLYLGCEKALLKIKIIVMSFLSIVKQAVNPEFQKI